MSDKNTIVKSVLINAPFELVSGYAADNQNRCNWQSNYSNFHYLSGSGEVGSTYENNLSIAGLIYNNICEIQKIEKSDNVIKEIDTFISRNTRDFSDISTGYIIETIKRTPAGTSVTLEHHFNNDVVNPLMIKIMSNSMACGLENLKIMMEIRHFTKK